MIAPWAKEEVEPPIWAMSVWTARLVLLLSALGNRPNLEHSRGLWGPGRDGGRLSLLRQ